MARKAFITGITGQDLILPAEVYGLVGDATRAREKLGWKPRTCFRELIETMTDADMERVAKGENHWISW